MDSSHGPEASCPGTSRKPDKIQEPATATCDKGLSQTRVSEHSNKSNLCEEQVTQIRGNPNNSVQYSPDTRNRTPGARVSLHKPKPEFQARINEKINKAHKLMDVKKKRAC